MAAWLSSSPSLSVSESAPGDCSTFGRTEDVRRDIAAFVCAALARPWTVRFCIAERCGGEDDAGSVSVPVPTGRKGFGIFAERFTFEGR